MKSYSPKNRLFYSLLLLVLCHASIASAQATRLKTSYSAITANNSPLWIAKDKGFFSKHHLDVQVVLIESGTTSIQALVAGETQIAQLSGRSEERRVGKEWRSRGAPRPLKKKEGIGDVAVTGVQTCALPISRSCS